MQRAAKTTPRTVIRMQAKDHAAVFIECFLLRLEQCLCRVGIPGQRSLVLLHPEADRFGPARYYGACFFSIGERSHEASLHCLERGDSSSVGIQAAPPVVRRGVTGPFAEGFAEARCVSKADALRHLIHR